MELKLEGFEEEDAKSLLRLVGAETWDVEQFDVRF